MTSPGEANVVPISLTLDGRTGYTIWAAPWVEDGEEWQAFLGAGSRLFVFDELDDMAAYIESGAENDLSDHPSWAMLQTLPADQLAPDEDYVFDVDEVPALTEREADDEVVSQVGDTVDMVQRIAECCEDAPLLHLLEAPAFTALLDEDTPFDLSGSEDNTADDSDSDTEGADDDGDEDTAEGEDDPWAEIGAAVRNSWPTVSRRLGDCLQWFAEGERPEGAEPAEEPEQSTGLAAAAAGMTGRLARDDSDEETGDEEADNAAADEKAAAFWNDIGITPVLVITATNAGYSLRCYLDDEAHFLGTDMSIDMFRSADGLAAFCHGEEDHDLEGLDTWPQVRGTDPLPILPAPENVYDLGAAEAQLHAGPAGADLSVLRGATDFLLDVAEYCGLVSVQEALDDDAPLGQAIGGVLRSGMGGVHAVPWNGSEAAALWRTAVAEVESCLRWHD